LPQPTQFEAFRSIRFTATAMAFGSQLARQSPHSTHRLESILKLDF
jgi:hypothetical protein